MDDNITIKTHSPIVESNCTKECRIAESINICLLN